MENSIKIVQTNLNRGGGAWDLLKQQMIEINVGLAIIAEPPRDIIESATCFVSADGLAAVLWRPEGTRNAICRPVDRGDGFVVIGVDNVHVVAVYISPNVHINVFSRFLDTLVGVVRVASGLCLVCGDFNAHSSLWNSAATNRRGILVERWSAMLDLRLLNVGQAYTCIRPQGGRGPFMDHA